MLSEEEKEECWQYYQTSQARSGLVPSPCIGRGEICTRENLERYRSDFRVLTAEECNECWELYNQLCAERGLVVSPGSKATICTSYHYLVSFRKGIWPWQLRSKTEKCLDRPLASAVADVLPIAVAVPSAEVVVPFAQAESVEEDFEAKLLKIKSALEADLGKQSKEVLKEKSKECGCPINLPKGELVKNLMLEFSKTLSCLREKKKSEVSALLAQLRPSAALTGTKEQKVLQIVGQLVDTLHVRIPSPLEPVADVAKKLAALDASLDEGDKKPEEVAPPPAPVVVAVESDKKAPRQKKGEGSSDSEKKSKPKKEAAKVPEEPVVAQEVATTASMKKQSIPKNVRVIVWNHYIGEDIIKHKCLCCKKVAILNTNFDVGHVISEKQGGTHEIGNLRPICGACNHSMGTENMIDFVKKYGLYIG